MRIRTFTTPLVAAMLFFTFCVAGGVAGSGEMAAAGTSRGAKRAAGDLGASPDYSRV